MYGNAGDVTIHDDTNRSEINNEITAGRAVQFAHGLVPSRSGMTVSNPGSIQLYLSVLCCFVQSPRVHCFGINSGLEQARRTKKINNRERKNKQRGKRMTGERNAQRR
jgi:hypothetical protein